MVPPRSEACLLNLQTEVPSTASGYLSSLSSSKTGCGSTASPWQLTVSPGQKINLTLYDFDGGRQAQYGTHEDCRTLAMVEEVGSVLYAIYALKRV